MFKFNVFGCRGVCCSDCWLFVGFTIWISFTCFSVLFSYCWVGVGQLVVFIDWLGICARWDFVGGCDVVEFLLVMLRFWVFN